MPDMHRGGCVVIRDHGQPARHRLGHDVAVGFRQAGEEEDIRRGVVLGQLRTASGAGEYMLGIFPL